MLPLNRSATVIVWFCLAGVVLLAAVLLNVLPSGLIGSLAFLMAAGGVCTVIGEKTPIVRSYLGGAPLVCVFGSAALIYFDLLPLDVVDNLNTFMKTGGFLSFYIAALITGSILGMDANLLKRAGARYVFPLVGGVICAMVTTALVGAMLLDGGKQTLLFVCFPIVGGGMGAGAVPMSEIVSSISGNLDAASALSRFVPALALANVMAIVFAGLLDRMGKLFPRTTGNGVLMKGFEAPPTSRKNDSVEALGIGLLIACSFFVFGELLALLMPAIHSYALMIISVAVLKILNVVPEEIEQACNGWYQFVVANFTPALLVGIGIAYTDLNEVLQTMSPTFFILVLTTVLSIVIASGLIGRLVGFYFVESALTSGLGMADMGGTGDVAVLSAARRMELMPFMQISSRIGGALILVLVSLLAPWLLG